MGKPVVGEVVVLTISSNRLAAWKMLPALVVAGLTGGDSTLLTTNDTICGAATFNLRKQKYGFWRRYLLCQRTRQPA